MRNPITLALDIFSMLVCCALLYGIMFETRKSIQYKRRLSRLFSVQLFITAMDIVANICLSRFSPLVFRIFISYSLFVFFMYIALFLSYMNEVAQNYHIHTAKAYQLLFSYFLLSGICILIITLTGNSIVLQGTQLQPLWGYNLYLVLIALGYVLLFGFIILHFKRMGTRNSLAFTAFILIPLLGNLTYLVYPAFDFSAASSTLALVLMYVMMQSRIYDAEYYISNHDDLTGLLNRRAYDEELRTLSEHEIPHDLWYASFDLNGLKTANDEKGHAAGDELIIAMSDCLSRGAFHSGKVFRIGGDEFAIIGRGTSREMESCLRYIESFREKARGVYFDNLSFSKGVVRFDEVPDWSLSMLEQEADVRMYTEKRAYHNHHPNDRRIFLD